MPLFSFYIEYEDRVQYHNPNRQPEAVINAANVYEAVHSFGKKQKLKLSNYEPLQKVGYRAYYVRKRLLKKEENFIYLIEQADEEEDALSRVNRWRT
ncbi:hypothetical protein [Tuberibacillus sp. Marseille-P3662]|uniref:hypothetical protein n=1 Tax=Tuberibacillus sp. Marseille-P3662 TaxID=1965358 RepID=UPI000A1CB9A3|nr:hypothetical protein [Tuberibacillus sp. Marseille-P3662]